MKKNDSKRKNQIKAAKAADDAIRLTTKSNVFKARTQKKELRDVRGALKAGSLAGSAFTPTAQANKVYKVGLHVSARKWAQGLELPFTGTPQKCPWNFNPVPSYLSFVATTVMSRVGVESVPSTSTEQWTFMPGHGKLATVLTSNAAQTQVGDLGDFDEVAYHYFFQQDTAGGKFCWGPVNFVDPFGTSHSAIAAVRAMIALAGSTNDSTSGTSTGMTWNATVPFSGDLRLEGHTRCKMLSMGVKFINTTPEQFRGGSIVTVQPVTVTAIANTQNLMTINPSFKDWGPDGCEVTWIPRMRDLAYWHPSTASTAVAGVPSSSVSDTSLAGPAIVVYFNNPTANAQSFDVECVAHWEISGFNVQTISTDAKGTFLSDTVLKSALSSQTNNAPTAAGFVDTLHAAAGGLSKALNAAGKVIPRMAPVAAAAGALL